MESCIYILIRIMRTNWLLFSSVCSHILVYSGRMLEKKKKRNLSGGSHFDSTPIKQPLLRIITRSKASSCKCATESISYSTLQRNVMQTCRTLSAMPKGRRCTCWGRQRHVEQQYSSQENGQVSKFDTVYSLLTQGLSPCRQSDISHPTNVRTDICAPFPLCSINPSAHINAVHSAAKVESAATMPLSPNPPSKKEGPHEETTDAVEQNSAGVALEAIKYAELQHARPFESSLRSLQCDGRTGPSLRASARPRGGRSRK